MMQDAPPPSQPWQAPTLMQEPAPASMPMAPTYAQPVPGDSDRPLTWAPSLAPQGDPGTLDLPWYGIGPVDAVRRAYVKTFRYDGRAGPGEYWWYVLYAVLLVTALVSVLGISITQSGTGPGSSTGPAVLVATLVGIVMVCHIPVGMSLVVRRLHDTGTSGWLYLIALIPYVGSLIILVVCCQRPRPSGARFDRIHDHAPWPPPAGPHV